MIPQIGFLFIGLLTLLTSEVHICFVNGFHMILKCIPFHEGFTTMLIYKVESCVMDCFYMVSELFFFCKFMIALMTDDIVSEFKCSNVFSSNPVKASDELI